MKPMFPRTWLERHQPFKIVEAGVHPSFEKRFVVMTALGMALDPCSSRAIAQKVIDELNTQLAHYRMAEGTAAEKLL